MSQQQTLSPRAFISDYLRLLQNGLIAPQIDPISISTDWPHRDRARSCALLLAPHPDDECLVGALPLRLKQEQGWQIINIAVTLGSNLERRGRRKAELAQACAVLGFDCLLPQEGGFSGVSLKTRDEDAGAWDKMVARLAEIMAHYQPQAIFLPHEGDWNSTHIGTHYLGMDALTKQAKDFVCGIFQTEYWQPLSEPNRMIGVSEADAVKLLSALACHVGEVARNPYDKKFPTFLSENVRRGSERVQGKGASAASMDFAMMYAVSLFRQGRLIPSALKHIVGIDETVAELF